LAIRLRTGWLRTVVNASDFFLSNMAALGCFDAVRAATGQRTWGTLGAGVAAGVASYVVNNALLAVAVRLASGLPVRAYLRSSVEVLPHEVAYAVGAAGFTLAATQARTALLAAMVAVVLTPQAVLVLLARRSNEYARARDRHQEERLTLMREIITIGETERFKTASDLHDGPVSHLSGLAMLLGSATTAGADELRATARHVGDALRSVQRDLRSLIFELSPHDLDQPGRIRDEVASMLEPLVAVGVTAELSAPDELPLARGGLELVHRFCREALANAQQHSGAEYVSVKITAEAGQVVAAITDDGRGFSADDVAAQRARGHFGTRFLEEKAELAGGSLEIVSERRLGSRLVLRLPAAVRERH
jgi:signal transduction histidine kinase